MTENRLNYKLKKIGILVIIACLALSLVSCGTPSNEPSDDAFEMNDAIDVSLSSAGLARNEVSNLHVEYDETDENTKGPVYRVSFDSDELDFEYVINAENGAIMTFDVKDEESTAAPEVSSQDSVNDNSQNSDNSHKNTADESNYIGVDKAKAIALEHAKVAESEVVFQKAKLNYDDGKHEYELEFYSDTMEYDYELDAHTGEILDWDHDNFQEDWDD